ncbi:MAG: EAL domain-containing protein, partial [Haliea sp.]
RVSPEQVMRDAGTVFDTIHPDDIEGVVASIDYSATHLTPWQHEYRVLFADDTERWLYGDSVPHETADDSVTWYGVITDITDRKLNELALRAAHAETQRFRMAMDHLSSYVYMKDRESRYIYANRATLELFNVTQKDLPGSSDYDFFPPSTVRFLHQIDARVLAGEQTTEEVAAPIPGGGHRYYLEIKTPIYELDNSGAISGVLGISTDITLIKQHEEQLEHIAHYDALTDLPNRVLLADRLQQAMARAQRRDRHLAVVYLDLDGFKFINDKHGHGAGDQLLIAVASRMKAILREEDTLSRLGGDEFVAVLLDFADVESSTVLLTRLLDAAAQPLVVDGRTLEVSASIGITFYPQAEPVEADQLLRQADQAMYQAKLLGKGRYHVFDADLDRDMRGRHERIERIRSAFNNSEFTLFYQPKVNMQTGEVLGAEALLRWQHPERGILAPGYFLPLIEDHPIMLDLGRWVVRTALQQISEWQAQGRHMVLSVNVSSLELRQSDFVQQLQAALKEFPEVAPQLLELEVLETSALGDLGMVSRLLQSCRELGVGVSLDDFGTGYSSLTYLKQLPAGVIKIDQSFVRDILDDPEDIAIFSGILGISAAFGRGVLAEGVETVEHGVMLLRLGCRLAQGYGIACPMPAAEFVQWQESWSLPPQWSGIRRLGQENLPLLYALVEHRRWVQDVAECLHNPSCPSPDLDPEHCQFSQWLREHRYTVAGLRVQIEQLHREAHEQARALLALRDGGEQAAALAGLDELYRTRDELVAVLQNYIEVLAG